MAAYIGPSSYGEPEPGSGERFITADFNNRPSNMISVIGDLDMKKHRIFNVKEPREEELAGAATVEFVGRLVSNTDNKKVNWSGGTMTGELNMGNFKIANIGNPEDDEDAVNKQYIDRIIQQTRPYALGRYPVFPHTNNTKSYFAVGSKRNIDLNNDKVVEIFNGNVFDPQSLISGSVNRTLAPIRGKTDAIMHFNSQVVINPQLSKPWTFLFSAKPNNPPRSINDIVLNFSEQIPGVRDSITISWAQNSFNYVISGQNPVMIEVDTATLNHFAFEYVEKKLTVWLNGISRKTHNNITLNRLQEIRIGTNFVGVLALYNR